MNKMNSDENKFIAGVLAWMLGCLFIGLTLAMIVATCAGVAVKVFRFIIK